VEPDDDAIVDLISGYDNELVDVFRGSEQDVLDRYYQAAKVSNAEMVVRITSDCPVIDPEIVDKVVKELLDNPDNDYVSNTVSRLTYPRGLDVEALWFPILEDMWKNCTKPEEREHVTWHITHNQEKFRILSVENDVDYSKFRWTVDEEDDFRLIKEIYSRLYHQKRSFNMKDILELFEKEPELKEINSHVMQKKE